MKTMKLKTNLTKFKSFNTTSRNKLKTNPSNISVTFNTKDLLGKLPNKNITKINQTSSQTPSFHQILEANENQIFPVLRLDEYNKCNRKGKTKNEQELI